MASRWKCWHCRSLLLLALGGVAAVVLLAGGRREGEQTSPALSIPSATAPVPLIQKPQGSQAQDGASGRSLKAVWPGRVTGVPKFWRCPSGNRTVLSFALETRLHPVPIHLGTCLDGYSPKGEEPR